jgi:diadenosine tetraphosphate (Ap4A) HIT family hydrolase
MSIQAPDCIFCRIASRKEEAFVIWEDAEHIAALTPFPNTPGFTVLFTRAHRPSYIFDLENDEFIRLAQAARIVAKLLDRAFENSRSALIAEGMGVDHAHVKIIPLHGVTGEWRATRSRRREFTQTYEGYVSSHDGPPMALDELAKLHEKILAAGK